MSDDSQATQKKGHPAVFSVVTAIITALTTVTVAKLHENTEATKARLGYEAIAKHVTEMDALLKVQGEEGIKTRTALETMNQILQYAFSSQAGVRERTIPAPPLPPVVAVGPGRPPVRIIKPKVETIPPPKTAAAETVQKLKTLSKAVKVATKDTPVKEVKPLPLKLDEVK